VTECISLAKVLEEYSPEARIFPYLEERKKSKYWRKSLIIHLFRREDGSWHAQPYRELDRTNDRDRFVEEEEKGDYPVLGGNNVYQYAYSPDYVDDLEATKFWSVDEDKAPDKSAKRRIREKSPEAETWTLRCLRWIGVNVAEKIR